MKSDSYYNNLIMFERLIGRSNIRNDLIGSMSEASRRILRGTVLNGQQAIDYFTDPLTALASTSTFATIALGEPRGLEILHILAVTAEDPTQLANSMGAIAAASNVNRLWRNFDKQPHDLSYIGQKHDQSVAGFRDVVTGQLQSSLRGYYFSNILEKGHSPQSPEQLLNQLCAQIASPNPDRGLLDVIVEGYFLTALGFLGGSPISLPLRERMSTLFLTDSSAIFEATEKAIAANPDYFDFVYGNKSSFWREGLRLFPGINETAKQIVKERKGAGIDSRLVQTIGFMSDSGIAIINDAETRVPIEQERLEEERADRIANPEKYKWLDAKREAQRKFAEFIAKYESEQTKIDWPPSGKQFLDVMTGAMDIMHETILSGAGTMESRAAADSLIPAFWVRDNLNQLKQNAERSGRGAMLDDRIARIVFLPADQRASQGKPDYKVPGPSRKIFRGIQRALHSDFEKAYPFSSKHSTQTIADFLSYINTINQSL